MGWKEKQAQKGYLTWQEYLDACGKDRQQKNLSIKQKIEGER